MHKFPKQFTAMISNEMIETDNPNLVLRNCQSFSIDYHPNHFKQQEGRKDGQQPDENGFCASMGRCYRAVQKGSRRNDESCSYGAHRRIFVAGLDVSS